MRRILRGLLLLAVTLLFTACGSTPQILDADIFYRRDLPVKVVYDVKVQGDAIPAAANQFEGSAVLRKSNRYTFIIAPKGGAKMDLLTITTCHREFGGEKLSPGFLGGKNEFKYEYVPVKGIEDTPSCIIRMNVLDAKKGKHAWAIFDFQDDDTTLPATVICNGKVHPSDGVSICQTRKGLVQRLVFEEPVRMAKSDCFIDPPQKNIAEFKVPKGECVFAFQGISSNKFHRLTTVGYEQIPIRGTE